MRRRLMLPVIGLTLATRIAPALADPFNGTPAVPADAGNLSLMPGGLIARLAHIQMQLNDVISRQFQSVHETGSIVAIVAILALAFLYGVVHAAVPGHGKTVVGSYFVANRARWRSGLFMGGVISLLKGVTAIAIVVVMSLVLHLKEMTAANQDAVIGCVSYGLVVAIGGVVFWRAVTARGCGHDHGLASHTHSHGDGDENFQRILIAVTGVVPCSSAVIILLFALANNVMGVGIAAVAAESLGMAVTVSGVGMLGIAARPVLLRVARGPTQQVERAERAVRLVGAAAMMGCAGLLMIGALSRL
ncbi:MAG TPA: hypothetical protein VGR79_12120 [Stellaceae bacterium]|nr:hypothetical protein [Stellaceae bacterium]